MVKRSVFALLLAILMLFAAVLPVSAEETDEWKTSEQGIQFIKSREGFSARKYYDYSQYSIGYGTACGAGDYPNGITVEEADALLRARLPDYEEPVSDFVQKNKLALNQAQFDALVSFTYNLGKSWLSGCRLSRMLLEGSFTEEEFASAMGIWCHAKSAFLPALADRRIREAQMFLYGDYTGEHCPQFHWLRLDANGGKISTDAYFYLEGNPYGALPTPECAGKTFACWMAEGSPLTAASVADKDRTAIAKWKPVRSAADAFSDVKEAQWFYSYVNGLYSAGIVDGYAGGLFKPQGSVTTGEALKMVFLTCGEQEQPSDGTHWASGYGALAKTKGITGLRGLDDAITRGELAMVTAIELKLSGEETEAVFADCTDGYAVALYRAKILTGQLDADGTRFFHPNDPVTRAELCTILYKVLYSG